MSGHMFFKERYFGYDDAIYASLRLLEILANSEKTVIRLAFGFAQERIDAGNRVDCPDDKKFIIAEKPRNISANVTMSSTWTASACNFPRGGG